jgi:hypothetical protein
VSDWIGISDQKRRYFRTRFHGSFIVSFEALKTSRLHATSDSSGSDGISRGFQGHNEPGNPPKSARIFTNDGTFQVFIPDKGNAVMHHWFRSIQWHDNGKEIKAVQ